MVRSKLVSNRVQKRQPQREQELTAEERTRRTLATFYPRPPRWYEEGVTLHNRGIEIVEAVRDVLYSMKNEIPFSSGTYESLEYFCDYPLESGRSYIDNLRMEGLLTFDPDDPETHIPVKLSAGDRPDQNGWSCGNTPYD
jgi:hypothetical protein